VVSEEELHLDKAPTQPMKKRIKKAKKKSKRLKKEERVSENPKSK